MVTGKQSKEGGGQQELVRSSNEIRVLSSRLLEQNGWGTCEEFPTENKGILYSGTRNAMKIALLVVINLIVVLEAWGFQEVITSVEFDIEMDLSVVTSCTLSRSAHLHFGTVQVTSEDGGHIEWEVDDSGPVGKGGVTLSGTPTVGRLGFSGINVATTCLLLPAFPDSLRLIGGPVNAKSLPYGGVMSWSTEESGSYSNVVFFNGGHAPCDENQDGQDVKPNFTAWYEIKGGVGDEEPNSDGTFNNISWDLLPSTYEGTIEFTATCL